MTPQILPLSEPENAQTAWAPISAAGAERVVGVPSLALADATLRGDAGRSARGVRRAPLRWPPEIVAAREGLVARQASSGGRGAREIGIVSPDSFT